MSKLQLPHDSRLRNPEFLFGVATSSYQIEGGAREGGRSPSIWDTFCNKPGAVDNADNGDVACDHYHLWKQDIEMIQGLGVGAYRLSMAWSRIIPEDRKVNQEGLQFYEKIIEECHARGLKVFVTLYHWDLPQYLEDNGGWLHRETAYKFAEYANTVSAYFGDKIDSYATLNEPFCSAYLGYRWGVHAPGLKGEREGFLSAHHLMLGHGLAIPHMRKNAPNAMHGCVFNATPAYPHSDADTGAAEYVDAEGYHWFMDPVLKGEYPKMVLERQSQHLPAFSKDDLDIIRTDLDFIGINFYTRCVVRYDESGEIKTVPQPEQEHTFIDWEIYPQGLTDLLLRLNQRYPNLPPLYITENGAANDDRYVGGEVNDEQRVRYFQLHLEAVDSAIKAGVDVRGYFAWSLMDNFEWAYGYKQRFGIVYVDYRTQKRTLKASAIAYRDMLLARAEEGGNGGS